MFTRRAFTDTVTFVTPRAICRDAAFDVCRDAGEPTDGAVALASSDAIL